MKSLNGVKTWTLQLVGIFLHLFKDGSALNIWSDVASNQIFRGVPSQQRLVFFYVSIVFFSVISIVSELLVWDHFLGHHYLNVGGVVLKIVSAGTNEILITNNHLSLSPHKPFSKKILQPIGSK